MDGEEFVLVTSHPGRMCPACAIVPDTRLVIVTGELEAVRDGSVLTNHILRKMDGVRLGFSKIR